MSLKGVGTARHVCDTVLKFKEPKTKAEVQRFLGLINYYNRFIYGYSRISKPLHDVSIHFKWDNEQKSAFQALKTLLTRPSILAYPNYEKEFTLYTDAYALGYGVILIQLDDNGIECVICFVS